MIHCREYRKGDYEEAKDISLVDAATKSPAREKEASELPLISSVPLCRFRPYYSSKDLQETTKDYKRTSISKAWLINKARKIWVPLSLGWAIVKASMTPFIKEKRRRTPEWMRIISTPTLRHLIEKVMSQCAYCQKTMLIPGLLSHL